MSFATFHDEQSAFFNAKFHPYVLTIYSVCIIIIIIIH